MQIKYNQKSPPRTLPWTGLIASLDFAQVFSTRESQTDALGHPLLRRHQCDPEPWLLTDILVKMESRSDRAERYSRILSPPNLLWRYSGTVTI